MDLPAQPNEPKPAGRGRRNLIIVLILAGLLLSCCCLLAATYVGWACGDMFTAVNAPNCQWWPLLP